MTHVEPPGLEMVEHGARQRQQALEVDHVAARLADHAPDLGRRQVVAGAEGLVGACFLDRVEIFALDILDQRQSDHVALFEFAN